MYDDELSGKAYDSRLFKRLIKYAVPYKKLVFFGIMLTLLASFLQLAGPYITKLAIDKYIALKNLPGLYFILVIYLLVMVLVFISQFAQIYVTQYFGQKLMFDLRSRIFTHLQSLSLRFFDKNPVGRLMTRVTSDVESLNQMFTQGIVTIFGDVFLLLGIIISLVYLDYRLALWTFSVIPFLFIITFIFRARVRVAFRDIRKWLARINSYMQENLTGMSTVQVFHRVEENYKTFSNINYEHTMRYFIRPLNWSVPWPSVW
jgi:ATP-binding cassette subfamily B multidrug efflux pump